MGKKLGVLRIPIEFTALEIAFWRQTDPSNAEPGSTTAAKK
jgi:hypothetical protein